MNVSQTPHKNMGFLPPDPESHINLWGISNIKCQKYSKHKPAYYLILADF